MNDIFHQWGTDLSIGSRGDLALLADSDAISQRVQRRLLTNAGDYIWNLNYGGSLAQFVGKPADPVEIEAVIRTQMRLETAVPLSPTPTINVEVANTASGRVVATITYYDPGTSSPVTLDVATG